MPENHTPAVSSAAGRNVVHFPGLNAYRFLAAAVVVLVHVEDLRRGLGLGNFRLPFTDDIGSLAVTFFFVLSGFLITYLLLKEKQEFGTVAIRKFYWRRVLRIWPLYYVVLFLAFALLNNPAVFPAIATEAVYQGAPTNLLLHIAFLTNVAYVMDLQINYANQLWSVGVEEQFYLIWPFIFKYVARRGQLWCMLGIVVAWVVVRSSVPPLLPYFPAYRSLLLYVEPLLTATRISCMAIGGIGAYILFFHAAALSKWLSSTWVDAAVVALIGGLAAADTGIPGARHEVFGLLFCYVILSSSTKATSILRLEHHRWNALGQCSYGLYMWHMLVLGLLLNLSKFSAAHGVELSNLLLYGLGLPLSIVVSWLSYRYIEKPFLKLKDRFTRVSRKC